MGYMQGLIIHDSGSESAATLMQRDGDFLQKLSGASPILHLYDWAGKSATYGYFVKLEEHLDLAAAKRSRLALARRPTGGGIVFHQYDFAFSILVPASNSAYSLNTLANYAFVNQIVAKVVSQFSGFKLQPTLLQQNNPSTACCERFCMAQPTIYDVIIDGKKVGGAAQRKTRNGFLHQGTIFLAKPSEEVLSKLLLQKNVVNSIVQNSYFLLGECSDKAIKEARLQLRELLSKSEIGAGAPVIL